MQDQKCGQSGGIHGDITVHGLDDWIIAVFRAQSCQAEHSLEEELRIHLTETAIKARRDIAEKAAAVRQLIFEAHGMLSDSTGPIREDRDTRG